MLRLRSSILTQALSSSTAAFSNNSSLHYRHLFATAASPHISPDPSSIGVVDYDYLVDTCGLTSRNASWAYTKLYHLKSTSNPDAVRAFLADLGLPGAHVATLIAKDPEFLCAKVDKTLSPKVAEIAALGLSRPDIARLLVLVPRQFRSKTIVSKLQHYLPLFGSYENLLWALRTNAYILSPDLDKAVKPNTEFLRECGLRDAEIGKLCVRVQWMLTSNPERVRAMVEIAEGTLGVPRCSGMFAQALQAIGFRTKENLTAKVEYLKNTFRWSDAGSCQIRCKSSLGQKTKVLVSTSGSYP
jgi:mTERF domain-containing protein